MDSNGILQGSFAYLYKGKWKKIMLYIQEDVTLVEEARNTGKGNRVWIEILRFLTVSIFVNLIMVFVGEIIKKVFFQEALINEDISMIIQLYESILGIGLVILYCYGIEKRTIMSMGFIKRFICKQYIKGGCVGVLLISAIVLIGVLFNTFVFDGINVNLDIRIILLFFCGFLLQGLYEEVVFRGFFMISIIRKNTILVAVMANSLLFGLTHGLNNGFQILALFNLILFGIFESIYMLKTGNIWGVSAIHSMWNFIQGTIYGFNISGMTQSQSLFTFKINNCKILSGGTFGLEGSFLTTVVLVSAINIVMLYKERNRLEY